MLFKRREKLPFVRRMLGLLWPRAGLRRTLVYVWHRLARLPDTPHRIAAGLASGVAVSFTPFLGLHIIMAILFCLIIRGNIMAALLGTLFGNPWTFPFIFALAAQVGSFIMGGEVLANIPQWSWSLLLERPLVYIGSFLPGLKPMIAGSLPLVLIVWCGFYFGFKGLIVGYKSARIVKRGRDLAQNQ